MGSETEQSVTTALTFKVPQKVGWSVQIGEKSWSGNELGGLVECLAKEGGGQMTLSLSLIFGLAGASGAPRLPDDPP